MKFRKRQTFTFDHHNKNLCALISVFYWDETLNYLLIIKCLTYKMHANIVSPEPFMSLATLIHVRCIT